MVRSAMSTHIGLAQDNDYWEVAIRRRLRTSPYPLEDSDRYVNRSTFKIM